MHACIYQPGLRRALIHLQRSVCLGTVDWLLAMAEPLELLPFVRVFDHCQIPIHASILHTQLLLASLPKVMRALPDIKVRCSAVLRGMHGSIDSTMASGAAMPTQQC